MIAKASSFLVLLGLLAMTSAIDTCNRVTECPVQPACRAYGDRSLFFANTFLSNHSFWLPNTYECVGGVSSGLLSEYYFFSDDGPGTFEEFPNPSDPTDTWARIGGTIQNLRKADAKWRIDSCILSGRHAAIPSDVKREFLGSVYSTILTNDFIGNNWVQYENIECHLVGLGFFAGAEIHATRFGPAAQQGVGANDKNLNNGLAVWLTYTVTGPAQIADCTLSSLPPNAHGDINIDIGVCTPCTCPQDAVVFNIDPRCVGSSTFHGHTTVAGKAAKFTFNQVAGAPVCP